MHIHRSLTIATAAACLSCVPAVTSAQTTGRIDVGAGRATDERGIHSSAVMIVPSVTFASGVDAKLSLGGDATLFQNNAWSLGGLLGLQSRGTIGGGFALVLGGDAAASRTSYDATFATAELTPSLEYAWSALTLSGGVRGAAGYAGVTTTQTQPGSVPGLPGTPATTLVSQSRTLIAPSYGAALRLVGDDPTVGGELLYRGQPMRVDGVRVRDNSLTGALVAGPVTLVVTAGHRDAADEKLTYGTGSVEFEMASGISVDVGAGRYPSNRLTGAAGGSYVNAGLSLKLGGGAASYRLPRPQGVASPPMGATRLSIRAPDANRVDVAGDWNDWKPVPAIRADNGVWYADLRIPQGEYRYAFRIDGQAWRVPEGAAAADDGFGGKSAYVTVRDAGAQGSHDGGEER
jgi:Glycogen recognition site of AMP-activated protein kinase